MPMKLITMILNLFFRQKSYGDLFSEALAESIKETIEEMGYHHDDEDQV